MSSNRRKSLPRYESIIKSSLNEKTYTKKYLQKTSNNDKPKKSNNNSHSKYESSPHIHPNTNTNTNNKHLKPFNNNSLFISNLNLIPSLYIIPYSQITIHKDQRIYYSETTTLYKGTYLHLPVTIKHYSNIHSLSSQNQNILLQELSISLSIHHPFILNYFGVCEEGSNIYLISEYLNKNSLYYLINQNCSYLHTLYNKVKMIYQIALAVLYLHSRNPVVCHRDLKSSNVLIDDHYNVKLCDFGIAKFYSDVDNMKTNTQSTPYWMAPEFVCDNVFTIKSDVYSFGILMWEVLMEDTNPYKNENYYDFILGTEEIRKKRPVVNNEKLEGNNELRELMMKCWDEKPNNRPNMEEVVVQLENVMNKIKGENKEI